MDDKNLKIKTGINKILSGIGLIVVLAIVVWGGVQIIKFSPSAYSSLSATVINITSRFTPNNETVLVEESEEEGNTETIEIDNKTTKGTINITPGEKTESIIKFSGSDDSATSSDPNGFVDLEVRILETGIISTTTNEFTATSSVRLSDRVAIRFEVINIGTRSSDSWVFSAVLPTFPIYIFSSQSQQALGPGDKIVFTLGFDSIENKSEGTVTINVDPTGSLAESLKTNNIAKVNISVIK